MTQNPRIQQICISVYIHAFGKILMTGVCLELQHSLAIQFTFSKTKMNKLGQLHGKRAKHVQGLHNLISLEPNEMLNNKYKLLIN